MKKKLITSIVLIILGVACFIFGSLISGQVQQGEQKIKNSQEGVNTIRGLSRINPYTKRIGKMATEPAQQKINQGKQEVKTYKKLSFWMELLGLFLFGLGVIFLIWAFLNKKKK